MNIQTILPPCRWFFLCMFLIPANFLAAQEFIAGTSSNISSETPNYLRFQKRMPAGFEGYVIEVATSEYPLQRTHPVFRKFGNIYYHKLREGGYSYLILTGFSDVRSVEEFHRQVVRGKVEDSKVIEYKKGVRFIK